MNEFSEPAPSYNTGETLKFPFIRIFLIITAWFYCIYRIYRSYEVERFMDLAPGLSAFLAGAISFLSFCFDSYWYRETKRIPAFFSTFITALCLLALFTTKKSLEARERTPVIIYATGRNGDHNISLALRKNGTYKTSLGVFFGPYYNQWGRYRIEDSTIYLDKNGLFDVVKTDRLLLKAMPALAPKKQSLLGQLFNPAKPDTLPRLFLYQVNHQGDTIPNAPVLKVNRDYLNIY